MDKFKRLPVFETLTGQRVPLEGGDDGSSNNGNGEFYMLEDAHLGEGLLDADSGIDLPPSACARQVLTAAGARARRSHNTHASDAPTQLRRSYS